MTENEITRINAFFDQQGSAWAIIEGAGMAFGDKPTGAIHKTYAEASEAKAQGYEPEELDPEHPACLHVAIARWDRQGQFWTYDF